MNRRLAIFDVDGTLTRTFELDQRCFVEAFREEFDFQGVHADWDRYRYTTDSGILLEVFEQQRKRPPTSDEIARMQNRLMQQLEQAWEQEPGAYGEVDGAAAIVARLQADPNWDVAVATGCWRVSAVRKLEVAGIDPKQLLIACSDQTYERIKILGQAIEAAQQQYGTDDYASIRYVGDGTWDVRSAREQQVGFLGIGTGARADALYAEGATTVLNDFANPDAVLQALADAVVPETTPNP